MAWRLKPKQDFPFLARFGVLTVTIVGIHETGMCYVCEDGDLAPFTVEPVEVATEPVGIFAKFATIAPKPVKTWKRQGFFVAGLRTEIQRKSPDDKAAGARAWLRKELKEPKPARQVLERATAAGFSVWAMYRARDFLGAKSIRANGFAGAGHWVWCLPD